MPTSISALLIIVIAIFPGTLGNNVYRRLIGVDWREKEFRTIVRLIGFSVVGVVLYSIVAEFLDWPPALHLFPNTYINFSPEYLEKILPPYIGHLSAGFLTGIIAAGANRLISKFSFASAYPSAWDDFIRALVPRHWVIISLSSGEVYAGKIKVADSAVAEAERDIVLEEPCQYIENSKEYVALNYQYLYGGIPFAGLPTRSCVLGFSSPNPLCYVLVGDCIKGNCILEQAVKELSPVP